MNGGGGGVYREQSITYEAVNQAIKRLKNRKAEGIDGITAEMLKRGGDIVREGGASRLDRSHHCLSLQREGQERGVWEL